MHKSQPMNTVGSILGKEIYILMYKKMRFTGLGKGCVCWEKWLFKKEVK